MQAREEVILRFHHAKEKRKDENTKTKMHTKAICAVAFLALNAVFVVGGLSQEYSEPWIHGYPRKSVRES